MQAWQTPIPPQLAPMPAVLALSRRFTGVKVGVERAVKLREVEDEGLEDYFAAKYTVGRPRWASTLRSPMMPSECNSTRIHICR